MKFYGLHKSDYRVVRVDVSLAVSQPKLKT